MFNLNAKYGVVLAAAVMSAIPAYAQLFNEPDPQGASPSPSQPLLRRDDKNVRLPFTYNPTVAEFTGVRPDTEATGNVTHAVMAGDWPRVASVLKTMPSPKAALLHRAILESLLKDAGGAQNLTPETDSPRAALRQADVANRSQALAKIPLAPGDVMDLLDALPGTVPMDDAHLLLAGQLLKASLNKSVMPKEVSEKLKNGTIRFGAKDESSRLNAVRFLLAADCPDFARNYLPSENEVLTSPISPLTYASLEYAIYMTNQDDQDADSVTQFRTAAVKLIMKLLDEPVARAQMQRYLVNMVAMLQQTKDTRQLDLWICGLAERRPEMLPALMVMMTTDASAARPSREPRPSLLQVQKHMVNLLAEKYPKILQSTAMAAVLNEFAAKWIADTESLLTRPSLPPQPATPGAPVRVVNFNLLSADQMLQLAPFGYWRGALYPRLRPRISRCLFDLNMMTDHTDEALANLADLISLCPDLDESVAAKALMYWAKGREGVRILPMVGRQQQLPVVVKGMPVTHIAQERNYAQLAELVQKIRKIYARDIAFASLPELLNTLCSQTELLWVADVEKILGPVEKLDDVTFYKLLEIMEVNLSNAERLLNTPALRNDVQNIESTSRRMLRGYQEFSDVLRNRSRNSMDYRLPLKLASTLANCANFSQARNVDAETCMNLRREAFGAMHRAADLYTHDLAQDGKISESPSLYTSWFVMAVGMQDLSGSDLNYEPFQDEIRALSASLRSLPGNASERHIAIFTTNIVNAMPALQPATKEPVMRYAMRIIGDHPLGRPLAVALRSYEDLLSEVRFSARVDGNADIGVNKPAGIVLTIEHSARLARESGGFSRYISSMIRYRSPYNSGNNLASRDLLEKYIRRSLADRFNIDAIMWAPENASPYDISPEGWQATPLAYLVVRAKDISTDRIPPIQLDLDFIDRQGGVVLPAMSGAVVINAANHSPRPANNLKIEQTLDDTNLAGGVLTLTLKATGNGILPEFDELFDRNSLTGVSLESLTDRGLQYNQFVNAPDVVSTNADTKPQPTITASREWIARLRLPATISGQTNFKFASLREPYATGRGLEMGYRQYSDHDVTSVPASVILTGRHFATSRSYWLWAAGVAVLTLGIGGAILMSLRKNRALGAESSDSAPQSMSAFAALSALREILLTHGSRMTPYERDQLLGEIQNIEKSCFAPAAHDVGLNSDWLPVVRAWRSRPSVLNHA